MTQQPYRESWVDRQIREAQERGDFDNLPGAGKPLGDLGDPHDPDWWVRRYIEREKLDITGALPTPLALRKEAAGFPQSLADVRHETEVREILEDFNHRVKLDRLRPAVGNLPPLLARTIDVDEVVDQWRALPRRGASDTSAAGATDLPDAATSASAADEETGPKRPGMGWWRRRGRAR